MDFIYTAIIDRFNANKALFTDVQLPEIKHFDLFKQQYIYPEAHQAYKKPAIFYQWSANWTVKGRKIKSGEILVRIHLELENYGRSFGHSLNRDYALEIFKIQQRVDALLFGFSGEGFTALRPTTTDPDENPTQTNVMILAYTTTLVDDTALQIEESGWIKEPLDDMTTTQVALKDAPEKDTDYYQVD